MGSSDTLKKGLRFYCVTIDDSVESGLRKLSVEMRFPASGKIGLFFGVPTHDSVGSGLPSLSFEK